MEEALEVPAAEAMIEPPRHLPLHARFFADHLASGETLFRDVDQRRRMAYRCPHYQCETASVEGLIQQVALSYLRHGYWWYVTGILPERSEPLDVDHNILTKYDIRKDWRFVAARKAKGHANLQYIRHGRFYIIMATMGWHPFKDREAKRIRDARKCPILIPYRMASQYQSNGRRHRRGVRTFEGYAVSYRRGGYLRKTPEDKAAYRRAAQHWKQEAANGNNVPRPPKGIPDPKWHSCVQIERQSYQRLGAYFMDIATKRNRAQLEYELARTGFVPYQPVKRQLVRIIKDMNEARRVAGLAEQIPYRTVLALKRIQVAPFAPAEQSSFAQVHNVGE